ncbi:unnamed protein product [Chilo suppressalis]|uniref:Uncharacterized protein n=1 Tax=Chilo suppressalis TaxID=168631 RepID=A0ABN8B9U6_CHISP|nr:unnamed protein product [Chilo suppressalis]
MASSNGKESSKMTASIDSLKLSSKNASMCSSKHASSESVLSKKDKECLQMQECKKKLLAMEPQIIIRDENVVLRSPPQKKIVMPPTINPEPPDGINGRSTPFATRDLYVLGTEPFITDELGQDTGHY